VLAVLLLGFGAYRLVAAPPDPGAPGAAAAQDKPSSTLAVGGPSTGGAGRGGRSTMLVLAGELVTLRGPGVQQPERETSATALGRIGHGWLVKLTSAACKDSTDVKTSYGVARATGRFALWDFARSGRGPVWRSPDGDQVLRPQGRKLVIHRAATGRGLAEFKTDK